MQKPRGYTQGEDRSEKRWWKQMLLAPAEVVTDGLCLAL